MEEYSLPDDYGGGVRFMGELLGEASTEEYARQRRRQQWTEMRLYRTSTGEYVVEKVGRTIKEGQTDRHSVHHSETPQGAIKCMMTRDADGIVYLTIVARECIEEAERRDPDIAEAYRVRDLTPS